MNSTKPITPVKAGLMVAALTIIFALTANAFGSADAGGLGFIQYLIIIVALVFFINRFGKANHYQSSFGELFSYGFKATTIYTLVFLVFLAIFLSLSPDLKQKSLDAAREEMEKKRMSDSDIEAGLSIASKYFWIGVIGISMFFLVLVGAIGSLIGAAITKKIPPHTIDQLDV